MIISSMCSGLVGMNGPDYDGMVAALGQEDADNCVSRAEMRVIIADQGKLRTGHFRGHEPS